MKENSHLFFPNINSWENRSCDMSQGLTSNRVTLRIDDPLKMLTVLAI